MIYISDRFYYTIYVVRYVVSYNANILLIPIFLKLYRLISFCIASKLKLDSLFDWLQRKPTINCRLRDFTVKKEWKNRSKPLN